ncbi:MAG TPA: CaiB/BaiF CoA-transferase family protein, partial [Candidatus Binataceae bacterium]|nr:CaiB/BaiF CoA-transferase family protein [Candidatus Binataceae bacterium]
SDSRWANLGAMDFTVQAASGIVDMTGYADRPGVRATAALIDTSAGMHLVAGILAALIERGRSGRGRRVEVAMLDICVPAVNGMIASALDGNPLPRLANRHPSACPSNTYAAADGQILIYCLTEDHWKRFARVIDRAELIENPRYRDHASRYKIIDEVVALVSEWVRLRKRDDLVDLLIQNGIPCAPVRTITEVAQDPELESRGLLRMADFGDNEVRVLGSAIKMSGEANDTATPRVPTLGENTDEVLRGIGIGADELSQLRRDGVI